MNLRKRLRLERELSLERTAVKLGFGSQPKVEDLREQLIRANAEMDASMPPLQEPVRHRPVLIRYLIPLGMDEHLDNGCIYDDVSRTSRPND